MDGILPRKTYGIKDRFLRNMRRCRDGRLRVRYLIICNLLHGRSASETTAAVGVDRRTVYRVAERFREMGEAGLLDRREDNGQTKLDECYLAWLYKVVKSSPENHGWLRPTWTREMLVETLARKTGIRVPVSTMSRALKMIGARRGRPRPTVRCPWPEGARNRRIRQIRRLRAGLPRGHVVVYEDEVDIHLNPKIGLDWMVSGQQKEVVTPGQNVKCYLAGALDAVTGRLVWVEGYRKDSLLFVRLMEKLLRTYSSARVIHVVLDNYRIHTSQITKRALADLGGRIVFHFLPPYCPDENKIERLWQDLHGNVTRNHRCRNMAALMDRVRRYLHRRNRVITRQVHRTAA